MELSLKGQTVNAGWRYLRGSWLSSRVFDSSDEIVQAACLAWRDLKTGRTSVRDENVGIRTHAGPFGAAALEMNATIAAETTLAQMLASIGSM